MDIPKVEVTLLCLFCGTTLEGPEGAEYSSGDSIKCTQCGEQNDYDSVVEAAKEKAMKRAKEVVIDQLLKEIDRSFGKRR